MMNKESNTQKEAIECGAEELCKFDWKEYKDTLKRFDQKISDAEIRLHSELCELKSKVDEIDKRTIEQRFLTLERALLEFLPKQETLLSDLRDGQNELHTMIGRISDRIDKSEAKIAEQNTKILALEALSKEDSVELSKVKHAQWKDRFQIRFASVLLFLWALDMFLVRRILPISAGGDETYMWVILSVVAFMFGESALKRIRDGLSSTPRSRKDL